MFFRTDLPGFGDYHLEKSGMPLYDAVEIKYKNGTTTENQASGVSIWAKECMLDDCVCII